MRIVELPPPQYPLPLDLQKRMDDGILGEDFVIGAYFTDGIPILEIKIEDLTPDTLGDYLEGSDKRHILEEELLSLLLPVEIPFDITLSLSVLSKEFCLGEKYDSSILGYTTCINSY